jgi:hypothetical protein
MPRKPSLVDDHFVQLLKSFIQKKAGLSCTNFSEVQQLQYKVKKETNEYLSIQTLNRFFGLVKSDFKPSLVTLNILAKYLHYDSFKEFEVANQKNKVSEGHPVSYVSSNLVRMMLSNIEVEKGNDRGLLSIMRNLCVMLKKHPEMADDVYLFMATTDLGRCYFFEQFVNMDALNGNYGNGLKYYITQTKDREQLFFAYSLLSLRYFLTQRYDLFNYYYNKILEYSITEVQTFQPSLIGRYYACHVMNTILNNEAVDIHCEATIVLQKFLCAEDGCGFPFANYYYAEALILAKEYELAWEALKEGRMYIQQPLQISKGYLFQYELLEIYAAFFAGKASEHKTAAMFEKVRSHSFYFLAQDYYTFFTLQLGTALGLKDFIRTASDQWRHLVEQTGFLYFRNELVSRTTEKIVLMEIKGKKIG